MKWKKIKKWKLLLRINNICLTKLLFCIIFHILYNDVKFIYQKLAKKYLTNTILNGNSKNQIKKNQFISLPLCLAKWNQFLRHGSSLTLFKALLVSSTSSWNRGPARPQREGYTPLWSVMSTWIVIYDWAGSLQEMARSLSRGHTVVL